MRSFNPPLLLSVNNPLRDLRPRVLGDREKCWLERGEVGFVLSMGNMRDPESKACKYGVREKFGD